VLDTPGEDPVRALAARAGRSYARRMAGMPAGMPVELPVGAAVRDRAGRALLGAALLGTAFAAFAALTTQDRTVRAHSPWQDDPYDALVSFTQLLVPVMVAAGAARAQLCRRLEPLPAARLDGLVRAARLVVVLVGVTAGADVVAVSLGTHREAWTSVTTSISVAAGALVAASVLVWLRLRTVTVPGGRDGGPDWAADAGALLRWAATRLSPRGTLLRRCAAGVDRLVDGWVRPRPVTAALALALAAGGLEGAVIGWREKGFGALFAFVVVVEVTSIFSVLVAANGYLRVLRVDRPLTPAGRVLVVAATSAGFGLSLAVAFRDPLWRLLGLGSEVQTLEQLVAVAGAGAGLAGLLAPAVLLAGQAGSRG
jgi:hypothetical protein